MFRPSDEEMRKAIAVLDNGYRLDTDAKAKCAVVANWLYNELVERDVKRYARQWRQPVGEVRAMFSDQQRSREWRWEGAF